jgi:hypothetical protein
MTSWLRRSRPAIALLAIFPLLQACQTTRKPSPTAAIETGSSQTEGWACLAFRPISWSMKDTPQTAEQVRAHNAAWDAVCSQ